MKTDNEMDKTARKKNPAIKNKKDVAEKLSICCVGGSLVIKATYRYVFLFLFNRCSLLVLAKCLGRKSLLNVYA